MTKSGRKQVADFAWRNIARLVDGVGRPTVKRGLDDLMSAGCRIIYGFNKSNGVCLTFDDGPSPHSTLELLAALKLHDVPATFYCIGDNAIRYPTLVKAIADAGHEIGNHTMTHPDLYRVTQGRLRQELLASQEALRPICGVPVTTFRAPYGHFRWGLRSASRFGIEHLVKWDVEPAWDQCDHNVLAEQILRVTKGGSIILLHDSLAGMDEALSKAAGLAAARTVALIAPALKAKGLEFRTVSDQIGEFSAIARYSIH
jgi:peptidoglycan/xylan/chitin deacetylase (PgdA/CDA1 family)